MALRKIGLIVESGPKGDDLQVCEALIRCILPSVLITSATNDGKQQLMASCGKQAKKLLDEGCDKVVIVWDLYPSWRRGERPCRHEDRERAFAALQAAAVSFEHVILICIREELEAWLLADGRALERILDKPHRKASCPDEKDPEGVQNPKGRLKEIFERHNRVYSPQIHAPKIIAALPDLKRIARSHSFARLHEKLTGQPPP